MAAFLVWITPQFVNHGEVSASYFVLLVVLYLVHQVFDIKNLLAKCKLYNAENIYIFYSVIFRFVLVACLLHPWLSLPELVTQLLVEPT